MALTRDFKETVMARAKHDSDFRGALLIEATDAFLAGDIDTGKALLRDYLNATAALPAIADELKLNEKSLRRMLGPAGNPTLKILSTSSPPVVASSTCNGTSANIDGAPPCSSSASPKNSPANSRSPRQPPSPAPTNL